MAWLDMQGPYPLVQKAIDEIVSRTSPGNYALGKTNTEGKFVPNYVGRSDDDVNGRLKQWVGVSPYPLFKYSYATSAKAAFEKECKNYHDFKPSENKFHPARPKDSSWDCPVCAIFD
jgi:hypothetical protein